MAKQIVWNKRALKKFDDIVRYLEENASEKTVSIFINKTFERLEILGRKSKTKKQLDFIKLISIAICIIVLVVINSL